MTRRAYHSMRPLLDRGALISICQATRGTGKSFPMLLRTMCRAERAHRSVLWLRRTGEEIDMWLDTFGSAKWLKVAKRAGIDFDRFKKRKNIIYYNDGPYLRPRWERMIRAAALTDWNDLRDTDDPREELIILDEAFCTLEKRNRYAGDEVHDFLDIFASMYREGENDIRALIMGNEEMALNPYFDYLKMKRPEIVEGIVMLRPEDGKRFPARYGAIAYERALNHNRDSALTAMLAGTDYGGYLKGDAKGIDRGLIAPMPKRRAFYAAADFGRRVTFWYASGLIWVSMNRAEGPTVRETVDGRPDTIPMSPTVKKNLQTLRRAFCNNLLRFETPEAYQIGMDAIGRII